MAGLLTAPALSQTSVNPSPGAAATNYAVRVKIFIKEVRDLTFDATIQSATVVDPGSLSATLLSERVLRLTGLDFGETIVIVNTEKGRQTLMVEVVGHPIPTAAAIIQATKVTRRSTRPLPGRIRYSLVLLKPERELSSVKLFNTARASAMAALSIFKVICLAFWASEPTSFSRPLKPGSASIGFHWASSTSTNPWKSWIVNSISRLSV
jgi:hypothetical protein